ncbi:TraR/DksA family transcriptional regulator [Urbifossiella limnaea]|uniref:RNA polymerase-binding transcription factor n=1 Tax=Urbifossiella limnaea TaxID=2528023 RepID=A0A517XMI9_9BACT|nr:TraR/DksA C4-type zinc finger protein [Urbifossiella limnaea]QDU18723.1 RNA polymerase-binding transcription factor [Urbifossiella limnaea]
MQLTLTDQEARTLRDVLRDALSALPRASLSVCEHSRREALCERLLAELGPGAAAGPEAGAGCAEKVCRSGHGPSAADLATYRQRLTEAAARLGGQVTALEVEARQPTGTALGTAEEATALELLHAEEGTLAEVTAALDRIDRGAFGRCEACGKPVSKARLEALPHARYCIACARAAG